MTIRGAPEDLPDLRRAVDAAAPDGRVEIGLCPFPADVALTVGGLTLGHAANSSDGDVAAFDIGVRSLSLLDPTLFRATGYDLDIPIVGGAGSGPLHGRGGGDVLSGGDGAQWTDGGPGRDPRYVDDAAVAVDEGNRDRVALFLGDHVVEDPAEGGDGVWAGADVTLSGHSDVQGLDGACVTVHFEPPAGAERLFLDGAATWARDDGLDGRTVGGDLHHRRAGRAGADTLTADAGDDTSRLLAIAPFRATVEDFWPGAGSDVDRRAVSQDLFPSREQAPTESRQEGPDLRMVREDRPTAVPRDIRPADRAPDGLLIV